MRHPVSAMSSAPATRRAGRVPARGPPVKAAAPFRFSPSTAFGAGAFACMLSTACLGQDDSAKDASGTATGTETAAIEEVVVTGAFQRSLMDALAEKRSAPTLIEALSAEDIGELPDTSVAESLARLPGLSHTRNAFGANNLSIRGLGAILTNGTLNDRDLASEWGDRSVAFNMFPAELVSRATVYKAPSASHVEGGIGGTVNLQTARALDWGERAVAVSLRARYNDLAGDLPDGQAVGYRASATYVDQFASERLGAAIGYAGQHAPLASASAYVYESPTVAGGGDYVGIPGFGPDNAFNIPYGAETSAFSAAGERHAVLATLQWRPVEGLEINFDGFLSIFEQAGSAVGLGLGRLDTGGSVFSDVAADGFSLIAATAVCRHAAEPNDCLDRGDGQDLSAQSSVDDADSELGSYGVEGRWDAGALTLRYGLSRSNAEGEGRYTTVNYRPFDGEPGSLRVMLPVSTFGENADGAAFLTSPLDFTDLATNRIDALRAIENERTDEVLTHALDAEYAFDASPFTALKAGLRFVRRDNVVVRKNVRHVLATPENAESSVAIDPGFVLGAFDQSHADSVFDANAVLVLDVHRVRDAVFPGIEAQVLPSSGHFIEEDVVAYYVQADFETRFFGVPASGNVGVRVVATDVDTQGAASVEDVVAPVKTSDAYTEALPSGNVNFFPADGVVVRLAASRAIARPAINFLSPGTDAYRNDRDQVYEIFAGASGGGNPFLRPFIANQLDLSFERYFDRDSAVALAFFYKDMDTFITQARTETESSEEGTVVSYLPTNGAGGRILGLELTVQHTFADLLPPRHGDIGVYATYTYTDSNIVLSETFNSAVFWLDGQSDHVGNVTLHYYRDKLGARLSYRYRSEFTRPQRPARAFTTNRGEGDLSFQVSYDASERLRFFVEGWNLLNEPRDNFYGAKSLQGAYDVFGRNVQIGATYRP